MKKILAIGVVLLLAAAWVVLGGCLQRDHLPAGTARHDPTAFVISGKVLFDGDPRYLPRVIVRDKIDRQLLRDREFLTGLRAHSR